MDSLDLFLKALENTYKEKELTLIPRWNNTRDSKFPAFTKFNLEVSELVDGKITQVFRVQRIENLSVDTYIPKKEIEDKIKDAMIQQMIEVMLKYYMYGESVQ